MDLKGPFCLFSMIVLGAGSVFGAYPLATDDAGIVAKGGYEIEGNYDNCRQEHDLSQQQCGISFKHGASEKMDIGFSIPYAVEPTTDENVGAASVSFKFALIPDTLALSFANEMGEKEYVVNGIYTKECAWCACHLNAGYLSSGDETKRGQGSYGVAVEVPLGRLAAVAEIQGREGGTGNGLAGVRYHLREAAFVAIGGSRAFAANEDRATAGFHVEF